jgi:hypothetical protein
MAHLVDRNQEFPIQALAEAIASAAKPKTATQPYELKLEE